MSTEAIHALFETCPHAVGTHLGLCAPTNGETVNVNSPINVSLLLASVVRLVQTSYTFGAAIPSGLFIPALFMGATMGRLVGNGMHVLADHNVFGMPNVQIEPGLFAIVGAVAMLSGFCRMTVSIVVIMLELTGELSYAMPLMCAALTAKLVGDTVTPSIYDAHAKLNGYAPIEEKPDIRLDKVVADLAELLPHDWIDATVPTSVSTLAHLIQEPMSLQASGPHEYGVILVGSTQPGRPLSPSSLVGVVERARLQQWIARHSSRGGQVLFTFVPVDDTAAAEGATAGSDIIDAGELVDTDIARLSWEAPLLTAYCAFKQKPMLKYCVCFDERHPGVLGMLSRQKFETELADLRLAPASVPRDAGSSSGRQAAERNSF
eukprot:CAMPEP_0168359870 /NCGR_PEP_ID=MMETSP0228-20121227/1865_1 /TAXON_ID=133427 /ORGANISM="Protoceratium reticulatum, Strain CCCM 535 (=CCMP 1889)" /LENGTH=376 /DNA_ID=CAMNT_0008372513 /DNA_START=18 /DNA_END=1145 /DNA_ORIENTATION=-